jgi:topoisomerase (DNA) II binding protein 1
VALAERLGATVNLSFSKDDPFDFCVAKTVNSPKYLLARARGVPAATPAWLRDSVAAGAFIKLDGPDVPSGYRPPPFAGLSVCVTGHSQDERADIEKRVVAYGGAYASDLVKGVCTHLIAADTTSAKYAHASRWDGVCIVKKEWVDACIAEKSRADETEFRVAASSAETTRRDSSARKSKDAPAKTKTFPPRTPRNAPVASCPGGRASC